MIVVDFNGRNINAIFEAVEYKAILLLVQEANATQLARVTDKLRESGFDLTPGDVGAVVKAVCIMNKALIDAVTVTEKQDEEEDDEDTPFMVQ